MNKLDALDDLIAVVKAGETSRVHIERMSAQAGLPEAGSIYGSAYQDDLNAARMTQEVMLPGWDYRLDRQIHSSAVVWLPGGNADDCGFICMTAPLGRTWLLAQLLAYRSTLVTQ